MICQLFLGILRDKKRLVRSAKNQYSGRGKGMKVLEFGDNSKLLFHFPTENGGNAIGQKYKHNNGFEWK